MQVKYYIKPKKNEDEKTEKANTITVLVPMELTHTVMELRGNTAIIEAVLEALKEKFEIV